MRISKLNLEPLPQVLSRYSNLNMRESVRQLRRKLIKESRAPQEGPYYWVPSPDNTWDIVAYFDSDYPGENTHLDRWDETLELLALRWKRDPNTLKRQLNLNYTGLPRGRVGRIRLDDGVVGYGIYHGNDSPDTIRAVIAAFNLRLLDRTGRLVIEYDGHETMVGNDRRRVAMAIGMAAKVSQSQED